jgi:ketosteroid isomerase-like protein
MDAPDPRDEAVLAANEAFYRAFNQKDVEAMDSVWARLDNVGCIHPGWNLIRGREAVLESWRSILTNPNQPRIVIGGAGVLYAGDAALVLCRELVGGSPLAATNVFVAQEGGWKLVHHQSGPVAMQ